MRYPVSRARGVMHRRVARRQTLAVEGWLAAGNGSRRLNGVGGVLYAATYCVTYGLTLGVLAVAILLPGRRIVAKAIGDGSAAARRDFLRLGGAVADDRAAGALDQDATPIWWADQ